MMLTTKYMSMSEVVAVIPLSRKTIYDGIKLGRFPKPTKLSNSPRGKNFWDVKDIENYLANLGPGL